MWAIPALADQTDGCSTWDVDLLGLNPYAQLFAEYHSQQAEQRDDRRRWTLDSNESVKDPYAQTNDKGYEQDFHCISSAQIMSEMTKNRGQPDEQRRRTVCFGIRSPAPWAG